ncbi:unnamed protein product [Meganyctiphanes norvegica]|uniref:Peroxisomal biogenesis factor 3 n=1 Tax=Meganyctiphanes norvegica TaxID=48144 RepID=A0AAV2RH45_MEGNR
MFARIKDVLYRHRRKFYIVGVLFGGSALLKRYVEYKLINWYNTQTKEIYDRQKKKQHYENLQKTINATILNLSKSLKEVILRDLDTDALLQAIKEQPQYKQTIWGQLKNVSFSRTISVVYVSALAVSALEVQLMLLGGYTFSDRLCKEDSSKQPISTHLQEKYLAAIHYFIEQGLPKLLDVITRATNNIVKGLPLTHVLTLGQLEGILKEIHLSLRKEINSSLSDEPCSLEPWSSYIMSVPLSPDCESTEERILYNMLIETCDILDSEDFSELYDNLIQVGINHLLDRISEFYPVSSSVDAKSNWIDKVEDTNSKNSENIGSNMIDKSSKCDKSSSGSFQSTMVVAKIIPVLSGLVHAALSPTPLQLLNELMINDKLVALGANVYEAFSSPDM